MELMQMLARPLTLGREMAARKAIKQFARKMDLVYFGYVNQRQDAHELIRGITVAATHTDTHFCVGHYEGYDISLVERRNTIAYPQQPAQQYHWLILQIDLRQQHLPHVFIDANHHDQLFYETLFMRFANFANAAVLFAQRDAAFARSFRIFAPADKFDDVDELFAPNITAGLAERFRQFDYEIDADRLFVYANSPATTTRLLQDMLAAGTWFAQRLDGSAPRQ